MKDLDIVPGASLALPREGEILDYQLWDENREPVIAGLDRDEMRKLYRECGGIRVKCSVTH